MIIIDNVIITDDVIEKQFACNLDACKGACCWEGDFGAPLEEDEVQILADIYPKVKPFLRAEGIAAIEQEGTATFYKDDQTHGTPLVNNGPCAYMTYTDNGIALCGIEQAYRAGEIEFYKPISCHLYPIRIKTLSSGMEALNYEKWSICSPACEKGKKEQIPVYKFLQAPLERKYGKAFFEQLVLAVEEESDEG